MDKIDFVVTWVNGADKRWQAKRAEFDNRSLSKAGMSSDKAYRDWGTFKYWFRGVEKFAPWINKVYLVTDDQIPTWLNIDHEKLVVIDHTDIIAKEYLPVFNSNAIEMNLHRIKGLAENFVYFNDDMYLTAPVAPTDFFQAGLPVDMAVLSPIVAEENGTANFQVNDMEIINKYFTRNEIIKNGRILSLKYGKNLIRSLLQLPSKFICGYYEPHLPLKFKRSTFEKVWEKESQILTETTATRFRDKSNVNLWFFRYWQLATGEFVPKNTDKLGNLYSLSNDNSQIFSDLVTSKHKIMCINDGFEIAELEKQMVLLQDSFAKLFPKKSTFEK
ncbi:Stealth CR1 domain-containing protein [Ligilactobacillus murinus]|uniref:stealth family protein n=1 Tax=Ligilactobacillus murinus TaxID=1622 RepID=UPI0023EC3DC6|nr:stealth family protein [Ligilactobacillus murinus]WET89646.1 Stealth CR1 domain-containing protein [Ligilactobacillus murinus]